MKLRAPVVVFAFAAIAAVGAGLLLGRTLRPDPTPGFDFDVSGPAYTSNAPQPGLSKGGFSGFGETNGLSGQTMLSGRVTAVTPQQVTIEDAGGTATTIRLANPASVDRIEAGGLDALKPGVTVVLRQAENSGKVEAVLVVAAP